MNYGIYFYAKADLFTKIKPYIDSNYKMIRTFGASDTMFFVRDFYTNLTKRNIKSVVIIATQPYSQEAINEFKLVIDKINSLQETLPEKLKVVALINDGKYRPVFEALRAFAPLSIVEIKGTTINNAVINNIIIAPILQDAPSYIDGVPSDKEPVIASNHNPSDLGSREPIPIKPLKPIDINSQCEADNLFATTIESIKGELESMELTLTANSWTHQELESCLESLTQDGGLVDVNNLIQTKLNSKLVSVDTKLQTINNQISACQQRYSDTKDENVAQEIQRLAQNRDSLAELKEVGHAMIKDNLYQALATTIVEDAREQLSSFKESIEELNTALQIKNSKERLEELEAKRRTLLEQSQVYETNFINKFRVLESSLSTQQAMLIADASKRKADLEALASEYEVTKSDKLREQFDYDKTLLIQVANEYNKFDASKSTFLSNCNELILGYQTINKQLKNILGLDSIIIEGYKEQTQLLMQTKTVQVVTDNLLGIKLETFFGGENIGKTLVGYNYGRVTQLLHKKCCVIDLDLDSPELHHYTESLEQVQELADFVNIETTVEGLNSLVTTNGSCYIANHYSVEAFKSRVKNYTDLITLHNSIIEKLNLLAQIVDKIIVILPNSAPEEIVDLYYKNTGKWYYVSDLNISNLEHTRADVARLTKIDSKKYYRYLLSKFGQVDMAIIVKLLNTRGSFNPLTIPFNSAFFNSKLTGTACVDTQSSLVSLFNFK